MTRLTCRLLFGALALMLVAACQGAPPQKETTQESKSENAVAEETFEGGDTGSLESVPESPTGDEEEPRDDSR